MEGKAVVAKEGAAMVGVAMASSRRRTLELQRGLECDLHQEAVWLHVFLPDLRSQKQTVLVQLEQSDYVAHTPKQSKSCSHPWRDRPISEMERAAPDSSPRGCISLPDLRLWLDLNL